MTKYKNPDILFEYKFRASLLMCKDIITSLYTINISLKMMNRKGEVYLLNNEA